MTAIVLRGLLIVAVSQSVAPVGTVAGVDLQRYAGDWFEVARFPNRFQTRCAGDVRASYKRRADGDIDVTNRCRTTDNQLIEAHGLARVVDSQSTARLKVRFAPAWLSLLPFVWGDYWVIGLADDYSWAVVGSPDRNYLWILSRTPSLDPARRATAVEIARRNGFQVDRLQATRNGAVEQMLRYSSAFRALRGPDEAVSYRTARVALSNRDRAGAAKPAAGISDSSSAPRRDWRSPR